MDGYSVEPIEFRNNKIMQYNLILIFHNSKQILIPFVIDPMKAVHYERHMHIIPIFIKYT